MKSQPIVGCLLEPVLCGFRNAFSFLKMCLACCVARTSSLVSTREVSSASQRKNKIGNSFLRNDLCCLSPLSCHLELTLSVKLTSPDWVWVTQSQRTCWRCISSQKVGERNQGGILVPGGHTYKEESTLHGIIELWMKLHMGSPSWAEAECNSLKVPHQERDPGSPAIIRLHGYIGGLRSLLACQSLGLYSP